MANEIMRIFFPLKIITYPHGEYGLDDNPVEMVVVQTPKFLCYNVLHISLGE